MAWQPLPGTNAELTRDNPLNEGNRISMVLTGGARGQMERIVPKGHTARIHLTITDDFPYAHAFVMIEALPA